MPGARTCALAAWVALGLGTAAVTVPEVATATGAAPGRAYVDCLGRDFGMTPEVRPRACLLQMAHRPRAYADEFNFSHAVWSAWGGEPARGTVRGIPSMGPGSRVRLALERLTRCGNGRLEYTVARTHYPGSPRWFRFRIDSCVSRVSETRFAR